MLIYSRKKGKTGQPDKVYIKETEPKKANKSTAYDEKIDKIFENLSTYLTEDEKRRFEGLLMSLALQKRDSYKINGEYVPTQIILNRIMLLQTSEIVEVFRKMRETEVKNYFVYLVTALYNAYEV